eukprot:s25_g28.t1
MGIPVVAEKSGRAAFCFERAFCTKLSCFGKGEAEECRPLPGPCVVKSPMLLFRASIMQLSDLPLSCRLKTVIGEDVLTHWSRA